MSLKHTLDLVDQEDLNKIIKLLTKYTEIMEILNENSQKSVSGGAAMYYTVEIKLEEIWV